MKGARRMSEIIAGILSWPWFSQRFGYKFNGYLVRIMSQNISSSVTK
jgi:hypothetical protein